MNEDNRNQPENGSLPPWKIIESFRDAINGGALAILGCITINAKEPENTHDDVRRKARPRTLRCDILIRLPEQLILQFLGILELCLFGQ